MREIPSSSIKVIAGKLDLSLELTSNDSVCPWTDEEVENYIVDVHRYARSLQDKYPPRPVPQPSAGSIAQGVHTGAPGRQEKGRVPEQKDDDEEEEEDIAPDAADVMSEEEFDEVYEATFGATEPLTTIVEDVAIDEAIEEDAASYDDSHSD